MLAVLLLVLANGVFVARVFALVSVRRTRVQQLGITIARIGLGWIGGPAAAFLVGPLMGSLGFIPKTTRGAVTHTVSFAFAHSIILTSNIAVGELAPKRVAVGLAA